MNVAIQMLVLAAAITCGSCAGYAEEPIGCTAIAVDSAASADGTAFAGMNADSGNGDYRLTFVPAKQHSAGSTRPVFTFNLSYPRFVGFGRGDFFHPKKTGDPLYVPVGEIPEARSTFGYYEATEPLMNDQGLGLGESSCASMLMNRFPGDTSDTRDVPTGLLDTVTLMQLALERCATARCAVQTMGELVEEFGFVPTPGEPVAGRVGGRAAWDDAGEAYTAADSSGEAWVFHVVGGVSGNFSKSAWVAQRVPKGHLAVVANEFIIGNLPEQPTEGFLFNKDIFRMARAAGLWDGEGPLHFARTFSPDPLTFESPTGATPIPLYDSIRRWALYNLAAPSLKLPFQINNQDMPFSVAAEQPLSHRDVMRYFRYQYEGTEFDMTKGMLAGPFGSPFRREGGPAKTGQTTRGISILRTLYSIIAQTGPGRQLAWFALDTPSSSVYVPLFGKSGISGVSKLYASGHQGEFSRDTAAWAFNFVCNYMQLNYEAMSKGEVYPAIQTWQDRIDGEVEAALHLAAPALAKWQVDVQQRLIDDWWKMGDFLVMKYNDQRINHPNVGFATGYPQWYADMVGFSNDVHPLWVQPASQPPEFVKVENYEAPKYPLPKIWDEGSATWRLEPVSSSSSNVLGDSPEGTTDLGAGVVLLQALLTLVAMGAGVVLGRYYEQRRQGGDDTYARLL
jgi:dipeptidase